MLLTNENKTGLEIVIDEEILAFLEKIDFIHEPNYIIVDEDIFIEFMNNKEPNVEHNNFIDIKINSSYVKNELKVILIKGFNKILVGYCYEGN